MRPLTICTLFGILIAICSSFTASAEERFALLIGNKNYGPLVQALTNPHNDIDRIGKALQQVGFSVVSKKDLGKAGIKRQISEFVNRLSNAGPGAVGFFYYAGHGVSRPGYRKNYLIPIDIQDMQNPDLWWDAIALEEILDELERGAPNASHFVVFDACRNELRLPVRSPNKGFEAMAEKPGIFIAFSTSPNTSASDGGANGSPYAQALASELTKPGVHHLDLFQNVKERVFNATGTIQRPWEINGLLSRFYFAGQKTPSSTPSKPPEALDKTLRSEQIDIVRSGDLVTDAKKIVEALRNEQYTVVMQNFTDEMKREVPLTKLQKAWQEVVGKHNGSYKKLASVRQRKQRSLDIVIVTIELERAQYDIDISYDGHRQIAALRFQPTTGTEYMCSVLSKATSVWSLYRGSDPCPQAIKFCSASGATDCVVAFKGSYPLDQVNTVMVQCLQDSRDFTGKGRQVIEEAFDFAIQSKWYGCTFRVKHF
jgi:hypothetical protein